MRKFLLSFLVIALAVAAHAQSQSQYPDSAKNVVTGPGGTPWSITNPLNHTGTLFTNAPVIAPCINCSSDQLHLYSCGFTIPGTATITGVEMIYARGACNPGSFMQEAIGVLANGIATGTPKTFVVSNAQLDTMGGSSDLWGTSLTPAIVNANNFGSYFQGRSQGTCTYQVGSVEIIVYYSVVTGKIESQSRKLKLYPNPVKDQLSITGMSPSSSYRVYDLTGRTVIQSQSYSGNETIDTRTLKAGLYFLKVEGQKEVEKFIVE